MKLKYGVGEIYKKNEISHEGFFFCAEWGIYTSVNYTITGSDTRCLFGAKPLSELILVCLLLKHGY